MTTKALQFLGFYNTPTLFLDKTLTGFPNLKLPKIAIAPVNLPDISKLRLGKAVERFLSFELKHHQDIQIIVENIQIQHNKRTLGELDCILKQNDTLIHLEIVYKFYLYDPSVGTSTLEHWIGPNRKDSLVEKLYKLKVKQFPLLYKKETQQQLKSYQLDINRVKQHLCFKAQLFVPLHLKQHSFSKINPDCIMGFYIHLEALQQFKDCKFFMPSKINWLQEVQMQTDWKLFETFYKTLQPLIDNKTAPLCWIKYPNGETEKCFVVWWS